MKRSSVLQLAGAIIHWKFCNSGKHSNISLKGSLVKNREQMISSGLKKETNMFSSCQR
jgi:hypothetical protein